MEIRVSKFVEAPVEQVFDVFTDVSQAANRIEGIIKVEILSDVTGGVGTRWRETRMMFGQEATEEMEISAFRPNQSYEVEAESRGTKYHTIYTFAAENGGTQVDMVFSGVPTTFGARVMSLVGVLFQETTRKLLEADMEALKRVCEA